MYLRVDRLRHAHARSVDTIDPERMLEGEVLEDDGVVAHAAQAQTIQQIGRKQPLLEHIPPFN